MTRTLQPPSDPYEFQTYKILMQRGVNQAEAIKKAQFWGALKRTDPTGNTVVGPADYAADVAAVDARYNGNPRIMTDPISGQKSYIGAFETPDPPTAALSITGGSSAGAPPTILEYTRNSWIGMRTPVDRFSLNPGGDYYAEIPGTAPTMFAGGRDLPIITGSGVDPNVLRWVAWPIRTTAAFAESRAHVAQLIELSLDGDPEGFWELVSVEGRTTLENYWGRIAMWVQTPVDVNQPLTESDYSQFYPDTDEPQ
jgi:hypothetical protein